MLAHLILPRDNEVFSPFFYLQHRKLLLTPSPVVFGVVFNYSPSPFFRPLRPKTNRSLAQFESFVTFLVLSPESLPPLLSPSSKIACGGLVSSYFASTAYPFLSSFPGLPLSDDEKFVSNLVSAPSALSRTRAKIAA